MAQDKISTANWGRNREADAGATSAVSTQDRPAPTHRDLMQDMTNVLNATGIATLVLDGNLSIRYFTPAIVSQFSLRAGDIGRPLSDMSQLAKDPDLLFATQRVLNGEEFAECDVQGQGHTWFMRRIQPCLTPEGEIDGVVITYVDITLRQQTIAALEAAEYRAQLATAAKTRFLAVASHDLRQPLQTMVILQGLLASTVTGTRGRDLVGRLAETLGAMSRMLDVILDINQIEAGVVQPNRSEFPIMALFNQMNDEFYTSASSQGIDLRIVPTSLRVQSDPDLAAQMLRNLVSNALKYTPKGKVLIGCRRRGADVVAEVWDTGIGIPDDELGAVFEEYHQLNNPAHERGLGMGLGLNIVQRLAGLLGHRVTVKSKLGKGSVFSVQMLRALQPVAELPVFAPRVVRPLIQNARRRGVRILVIEDDESVSGLLELFLQDQGHEPHLACDGPSALAMLQSGAFRPDIVLTDYNLPGGMDGLALAEAVRGLVRKDLPVILLTGDITAQSMLHIAGQDVLHLAKPVTVSRLGQAINTLVGDLDEAEKGPALPAVVPTALGDDAAMIHIVDDEDDFRAALRMTLEDQGYRVSDYASCEAFLADPASAAQGCLLLDAYLPGMAGLTLLAHLKEQGNKVPVIMITGQSDVAVAVAAMKAGAFDFLEKPVTGAEISASVARAIAGRATPANGGADPRLQLTKRQKQVLDGVLAGQASKNIAYELGISQRTVESHRAAIMDRIGARSLPELVRKVLVTA